MRILGAVMGLLVALILNSAALLALTLFTRVFIELGDVVVGLVINGGSPDANTLILTVLAGVEFYFILLLLRHIKHTGPARA